MPVILSSKKYSAEVEHHDGSWCSWSNVIIDTGDAKIVMGINGYGHRERAEAITSAINANGTAPTKPEPPPREPDDV